MATLDERVAYLEGQVVLLPQIIAGLRDELSAVRHALQDGLSVLRQDLRDEIGRVDARVDSLEDKMSRQFLWLVGIQITTFVTTLAAILGVFYTRR